MWAFLAINFALFPLSAAGYLLWIGKLIANRNSQVSATAQGPLFARHAQNVLGVRDDTAASALLDVLPGVSRLAVQLTSGPLLLAHRVTGYVPKTFRYPFEGKVVLQNEGAARSSFFDAVLERALADISQLVIMGAGFDTRSYRLPKSAGVRCFELDGAATQAVKRRALADAHVDASHVRFVRADFDREDWLDKLLASGFDPNHKSLFIWEGVTMYLTSAGVEATLRKIGGCARGSLVAFDYFTDFVIQSKSAYMRYARLATRMSGEPLLFGFDSTPPVRERVAETLAACGLELVEHKTFGEEREAQRAWGGFAVAAVR